MPTKIPTAMNVFRFLYKNMWLIKLKKCAKFLSKWHKQCIYTLLESITLTLLRFSILVLVLWPRRQGFKITSFPWTKLTHWDIRCLTATLFTHLSFQEKAAYLLIPLSSRLALRRPALCKIDWEPRWQSGVLFLQFGLVFGKFTRMHALCVAFQ